MYYEYEYEMMLEYRYNNNLISIKSENIKSLVIDSDYEKNTSPISILTIIIDKSIKDIIIKNKDKGIFHLIVYKYIKDQEFPIKEEYINENFIYFLSDNTNKNAELDYSGVTDRKDLTTTLVVGLVKQEILNLTKRTIINKIFANTRLINIICYYSSGMNLLIEPPNKTIINNLPIPPLTSYQDFIRHLDNKINIYENSYYRLFFDYYRTYILSGSGKAVYAKGEKQFPIVFNIESGVDINSKKQGMEIGENKYNIYIDASDTEFNRDAGTSALNNKFIGIDKNGNTYSESINSSRVDSISKAAITRTDNLNNIKSVTSSISNKERVISVVKNNLDTSILTINKEYIIKHFKESDYDGNYILIRKRELFMKESTNFILSTVLTFSKVNS